MGKTIKSCKNVVFSFSLQFSKLKIFHSIKRFIKKNQWKILNTAPLHIYLQFGIRNCWKMLSESAFLFHSLLSFKPLKFFSDIISAFHFKCWMFVMFYALCYYVELRMWWYFVVILVFVVEKVFCSFAVIFYLGTFFSTFAWKCKSVEILIKLFIVVFRRQKHKKVKTRFIIMKVQD